MAYTTINKGSSYFNTILYTGTGATNNITGVGFKPDWVWIKNRDNGAAFHRLVDAVRGATKLLYSNGTNAEDTDVDSLTSFNVDGFTVGNAAGVNQSGSGIVSWNWLGANTTVSNTSGSITSTVSANPTAGFSVVGYTGNGTTGATVGHGLGVTPAMIIQKRRTGSIGSWRVWQKSIYATSGETNTLFLNTTAASGADGDNISGVSSTTFTTRGTGSTNPSGDTCIAYCFAEIRGYSKFDKYTGNGSTNGTFVYTGFKPAYIMIKRTNSTGDWVIFDSARNPINSAGKALWANLSDAEATYNDFDILSNGFKLRFTSTTGNGSGDTYIYMAFAQNPFVTSGGIPVTAR
jgi:hypothetical protein